jgi:hypothetical protein
VLIPCRPSAFDLAAIKTTVSLVRLFDKPSWSSPPARLMRRACMRRPSDGQSFGIRLARTSCLTVPSIAMPVQRVPR